MRCFDTDWEAVLRWLPVWERLSTSSRRYFLNEGSPHMVGVPEEGYGTDLALVLESGLAIRLTTGNIRPAPDAERFWRLMRHLLEFPLFDEKPTSQRLAEYVDKYYTRDESDSIQSSRNKTEWDSEAWPQSFLQQKNPQRWEKNWLTHQEYRVEDHRVWHWNRPVRPVKAKSWFPEAAIFSAAQALVRAALDSPSPLPLVSLADRLPTDLCSSLAPALKACLRYLLLYPALRKGTLEAVIGPCPVVLHLRNRPPAVPPTPRSADGLLGPAFLMEDMTRILALAAAGECRLKQSYDETGLFKKVEARLFDEFASLPSHVESHWQLPERLEAALHAVYGCRFTDRGHGPGGGLFLRPNKAGHEWLARPPHERLHHLLREFRKDDGQDRQVHTPLRLAPTRLRLRTEMAEGFDARPWLDSIWREAAGEDALSLDAFLEYHARVSHPWTSPAVPEQNRPTHCSRYDYNYGGLQLRAQNIEEITRELLTVFFWERLVPLGCVETTAAGPAETLFRLSSAGRCFFGLQKEIEYGQPVQEARVVVQPNFEIVFLHPSLPAEIEFTPFAERCGHGVGTLFRLTRRQSLRAAAQGVTADIVLASLGKHCSGPVPANVKAEVQAWFGACRTLVPRRAILLEAGDAETALRVKKLLGPKATVLGKTLVEWPGGKLDAALRRKLAGQGIFIPGSAPERAPRTRPMASWGDDY